MILNIKIGKFRKQIPFDKRQETNEEVEKVENCHRETEDQATASKIKESSIYSPT